MTKRTSFPLLFLAALAFGLLARLYFAWGFHGNFDQDSYEIVRDLVANDRNPYASTSRYNYSPLWFWILDLLGRLNSVFGGPYSGYVRSFLTGVDAVTALLIYKLVANNSQLNARLATLAFWLSPVAILITGYHGQFDNLAIAFIMFGLWAGWCSVKRPNLVIGLSGIAAILIKHTTFFWPPFILGRKPQKLQIRLLWWGLAVSIFLLSFLPYWSEGQEGIRANVFGYGGSGGRFGLSMIFPELNTPVLMKAFKILLVLVTLMALIFLEPRRDQNDCSDFTAAARYALLPSLIFLVLAPGFGMQYLVFPIALGALRPSWAFAFYSFWVTFWLLGNRDNVNLSAFHSFGDNLPSLLVWLSAVTWLAFEVREAWRTSANRKIS